MTGEMPKGKIQTTKPRAAPGPKAQTLTIKGNWQAAMKKSLKKKKPPEGWPK